MFQYLYPGSQPVSELIFDLGCTHLQHLSMMHAEFLEFLHVSAVALVLFFIFCGFPGSKHLKQSCLSVWRPVNETFPLFQQHKGPWQAPITLWLCQLLLKLGIWKYKQLIISREHAFACGFFISVGDVTFRVVQTEVRAVTKSYHLPSSKPSGWWLLHSHTVSYAVA